MWKIVKKFNAINFNSILQWSDALQQVYPGNRTAQLIGDHVGRTYNQVCKELSFIHSET